MKKIFQTIGKLLIGIGVIFFVFYIIFVFSFYELFLQSRLMMKNIYLRIEQVKNEANCEIRKRLIEKEINAYKEYASVLKEEIPKLREAKKKGLKKYILAYLSYKKKEKEAKRVYKKKMEKIKKEIHKLREKTCQKVGEIIKNAKKELNPLNLLWKRIFMGRNIKGYNYDSYKGKIEPRY